MAAQVIMTEKELNRLRYSEADLRLMAEIGGFDLDDVNAKLTAARKASRKAHDDAIEEAEKLERQAQVQRNVADSADKRTSVVEQLLQKLAR